MFLRGRPDLAQAIPRLVNPGKRIPDPTSEPNFAEIAKRFPLPPDPLDELDESNHDADEEVEASHHQPQAEMLYNQPEENPNYNVQEQPQYAPPPNYENQQYSYPPNASHGYPPGYGYGHPPPLPYPMYPPYPYPYPHGYPYGRHHFHTPYTSQSHPSAHYNHNPQYYRQSPHYLHDDAAARQGYAQHSQGAGAERQDYEWSRREQQLQPPDLNQHVDTKSSHHQSPNLRLPVIYSPASTPRHDAYDHHGHGYSMSAFANQQYYASHGAAAASYPSESMDRRTGYEYVTYARGLLPAESKRAQSTSSQEELAEYPTELGEQKPPARNIRSAPPATRMPDREHGSYHYETYSERKPAKVLKRQHSSAGPAELDERKPAATATNSAAQATMMSPNREFHRRLEWSESFSNDVCDYLLGTEENKPSGDTEKE
jgi:hypothetical protein